jgi:pyridoxine/pyridoxamine 5'-phosphate oxidase
MHISTFGLKAAGSEAPCVSQKVILAVSGWRWSGKLMKKLTSNNIDRPSHWGGYCLMPAIIEFWQGRQNRLHDRLQYTLQDDGNWKIERLAP